MKPEFAHKFQCTCKHPVQSNGHNVVYNTVIQMALDKQHRRTGLDFRDSVHSGVSQELVEVGYTEKLPDGDTYEDTHKQQPIRNSAHNVNSLPW